MSTKLTNQGADGIRRVGFYSDGDVVPVKLYIKDNCIHSYQMNCDVVETARTYRGNDDYVSEYLCHPRTTIDNHFVTPENEHKVDMMVQLIPLLVDSFSFMEPRSAELHSKITDISNDIFLWALTNYNPSKSTDIDEIEYVLQPFWERERSVYIDDVPPLEYECPRNSYTVTNFVIHQRADGYWHIVDCINKDHFEDYLLPNDSVGDVWLISYETATRNDAIHELSVYRIKG